MNAAVLKAPGKLELTDRQLRKLRSDEILVKVDTCGVCGTDHRIFQGTATSKIPVILGHEYSGVVVDKDSTVKNISVGDHVVIDPNINCGYCSYCKKGKVHLCENLKALGVTLDGGFAEYSIIPFSQAYRIPNDFPLSIASFAEPLSCCLRGIDQAKIKHGDSVAIIGGGFIGQLMLQLAKAAGAHILIFIEPILEKQKLGREFGADYAFSPLEENLIEKVKDLTLGGMDVVIECAGKVNAVGLAIQIPKRGGRVVIFGLAGKNSFLNIDLQYLFENEITIKGSFLNPFTFQRAIDLLISGKISVGYLIPEKIKLENICQLFKQQQIDTILKYQIHNN